MENFDVNELGTREFDAKEENVNELNENGFVSKDKSKESEEKIDPKKMQSELEELVKTKFGDKVHIVSKGLDALEEEDEPLFEEELELEFDYRPKDIKAYLDDYVISQDEAKKTLAIAICDHYNHIKRDYDQGLDSHYFKQNILMLGPTGVGKTYLIKKIAQMVGVPFVKADATKFTEAGYVGANVEDTIRDLITQADGNVEMAQYGIVYIDEADKLAGGRKMNGKDVSGRGVQNGLLKLLEETEIDTRSPFDMLSQINNAFGSGAKRPKTINTKNILFILSGAFSGLEDIIKRRLNVNQIGFTRKTNLENQDNLFALATTQDFIEFGIEPELIGRLPVRVNCNHLTSDNLYHILQDSKESILKQYTDSFASYGIKVDWEPEALEEVAKMAHSEKTGARSLMTIFEKIFRDYKFELPSSEIESFTVTKDLVKRPKMTLEKILAKKI